MLKLEEMIVQNLELKILERIYESEVNKKNSLTILKITSANFITDPPLKMLFVSVALICFVLYLIKIFLSNLFILHVLSH